MARKRTEAEDEGGSRLRSLEAENAHLRAKLRLLGERDVQSGITISNQPTSPARSIAGLEEMYLQVAEDGTVINLNQKMANLIGDAKQAILNRQLAASDRIPWAPGVFETLITECKATNRSIQWETEYTDSVSDSRRSILFRVSLESGIASITAKDTTSATKIMRTFSRYVGPALLAKMQESEADFFCTERMNITILFADLRGFTAMSASMNPAGVKDLLNEFLCSSIAVVDRFEGTVDKIIGDEIMVLFGAPVSIEDHAYRAVKTAIALQLAHNDLLTKWKTEGRPTPPVGIGLNSGEVVVGNVGSDTRMNYTAIGHNVNLASRLCAVADGGEILVSEGTVIELSKYVEAHQSTVTKRIKFQKAGEMALKGLQNEVTVARVLYKGGETP